MKNTSKLGRRIAALEERHGELDEQIAALGEFPDTAEVKLLKRQKLKLKEEILAQQRILAAAAAKPSIMPEPPNVAPESISLAPAHPAKKQDLAA